MKKLLCMSLLLMAISYPAFAQLTSVQYFAYQIQMLDEPGAIDSIVDSRYDMVILEPTNTEQGMESFDAAGMVSAIKASPGTALANKIVLAYIDIGQAEEWRIYWEPWWEPPTLTEPGNPDFIVTLDPDGWSGCYPVAYWDIRWQNIMVNNSNSLLKLAIADGFDGIYMDWVEAYDDEYVMARAVSDGVDAPDEMISFIEMIRDTARNYNPDFLVVAQNAADLCDGHAGYFDIIDGISQEDLNFYGDGDVDWGNPAGGDQAQDPAYKSYLVSKLDLYLAESLPVFIVDYCLVPANTDAAYTFDYAHNYIPFVTQTSLSQLPPYTPPEYLISELKTLKPEELMIHASPNPFNSSIRCQVSGIGEHGIEIEIFDLRGNRIADFTDNREFIWIPDESIGSGVFFVKASTNNFFKVSPVMYIK